jgi:hypothetical protein
MRRFDLRPRQTISVLSNNVPIGAIDAQGIVMSSEISGDRLDVSGEPGLIRSLLSGDIHWDDGVLSMRLNWSRQPNYFCADTMMVLNYLRAKKSGRRLMGRHLILRNQA